MSRVHQTEAAVVSSRLGLTLVFLPLLVFLIDLGTPPLWDPDEGRHAEIAREMLVSGDWMTPQLSFEPYREKLPVYYWVLAGSLAAFGHDAEVAVRLPSAVLAILGIWSTAAWGSRFFDPVAGALAGIILATAAGYVGVGRLALIDGPYSVLEALALFAMARPLLGTAAGFPWLFYGALAAATLIRGPVALLTAALVAVLFVAVRREPARLRRLRPVPGMCLLAAVFTPLVLSIARADGEYLPEFLWRYNLLRFVSAEVPGTHREPALFFLWFTPLLLLPWALFLPSVAAELWKARRTASDPARTYLLVWAGVVIGFFTVSAAKLPSYTLPALFPLSLLTARSLAERLRRPSPGRLRDPVLLTGLVVFATVIVAAVIGYQIVRDTFPSYADRMVYLLALIPLAIGGIAAVAQRNRFAVLGWITLCSAACLIGFSHWGAPTVSAYNSLESPARMVEENLPPQAPLLSYGTATHSFSFYSGRSVTSVEAIEDAAGLLNGDAPVALLTKDRQLSDVRAVLRQAIYFWWESDSKKILLSNKPPPPGHDSRILLPAAASADGSVTTR